MKKIDHIGIAVKDLKKSNTIFKKLFGKSNYKQEIVKKEGVVTSFFQIGDATIELLASNEKGSPIDKYLNKKSEGIHHISFEVFDIHAEIERLEHEGFSFVEPKIRIGAGNKLVSFLYPKETNDVLIELSQKKTKN